jgi:hypothetical protein
MQPNVNMPGACYVWQMREELTANGVKMNWKCYYWVQFKGHLGSNCWPTYSAPPVNVNYAIIEKGESGFYKCVNFHLQTTYNRKHLSTLQAQCEVTNCLNLLIRKGFPVTLAWMDQS